MSQIISIVCDVCDRTKQETNHWFRVGINADDRSLFMTHAESKRMSCDVSDWQDVCGQKCAHVVLSRWLENGTLESKEIVNNG